MAGGPGQTLLIILSLLVFFARSDANSDSCSAEEPLCSPPVPDPASSESKSASDITNQSESAPNLPLKHNPLLLAPTYWLQGEEDSTLELKFDPVCISTPPVDE